VVGRELIFSNREIADLITSSFVAYAGDQWYLHRQQDEVGTYFWKVVDQGYRAARPKDETRQGIYIATGAGKLLASDPFRPHVGTFLTMLRRSLDKGKTEGLGEAPASAAEEPDARYARTPPAGGLILKTFTRIPLPPAEGAWKPNQAVGRDHVWLTRDEERSLVPASWEKGARMPLPPAVAERIARFHLTDNVRGEPPMWARDHVRQSDLTLTVLDPAAGRLGLSGTVRLASHDGRRGYDARMQGLLTLDRKSDRVTRFDALSWGEAWGEGPYTRGAPPGRFPLLVRFSVAGNAPADHVPPQGSREVAAYFGTAR
jgi:hypothetical protein